LRVMVIDDSVVFRLALYKILESLPEISEVQVATGGNVGLEKMAAGPVDLVFCDIEMPLDDGDGITALQKMKRDFPTTGVVMVSSMHEGLARKTIKSLFIGAVDFIPKPAGEDQKENEKYLRRMVRPIISMFSTRKYTSAIFEIQAPDAGEKTANIPAGKKIHAVCIGGATGGPQILQKIIPELPMPLNVPIFIVQHMQSLFTQSLAECLQELSAAPVKEAEDGEKVERGHIYIAPGASHLTLQQGSSNGDHVLCLNDGPPVNFAKPSIDVFLKSVASEFRGDVLSVILTGMGKDGMEGVKALKEKGGVAIVQDRLTAVIAGMPESVVNAGCADEILPGGDIGVRIREIISRN
ncbi:chemotaxis-specific protein-glutamate methyltransferase CheB, partial [Planctomycetota bacterium]